MSCHANEVIQENILMSVLDMDESDIIEVKPLPYSGYIYSSEITTDAANFKNLHLKSLF